MFEWLRPGARERREAKERYAKLLASIDPSDLAGTATTIAAIKAADRPPLTMEEIQAHHLVAFQRYAEAALADSTLSGEEDGVLYDLREALDLDYQTLTDGGLEELVQRLEIARINVGRLYIDVASTFDAEPGEYVLWDRPASLMKVRRRRKGEFAGVSIHVARGVTFHTGQFQSTQVADRELVEDDFGHFTITTERALFRGSSKTIRFEYDKILDLELFTDAIRFHMENRERVDTLAMASALVAAATIDKITTMDRDVLLERLHAQAARWG